MIALGNAVAAVKSPPHYCSRFDFPPSRTGINSRKMHGNASNLPMSPFVFISWIKSIFNLNLSQIPNDRRPVCHWPSREPFGCFRNWMASWSRRPSAASAYRFDFFRFCSWYCPRKWACSLWRSALSCVWFQANKPTNVRFQDEDVVERTQPGLSSTTTVFPSRLGVCERLLARQRRRSLKLYPTHKAATTSSMMMIAEVMIIISPLKTIHLMTILISTSVTQSVCWPTLRYAFGGKFSVITLKVWL